MSTDLWYVTQAVFCICLFGFSSSSKLLALVEEPFLNVFQSLGHVEM